ncbi:MAG TPA: transglycosylase SLT domain-containing protein [Thermoleophilaceae bacterium]|nr:transglycosylase SLT domain-containing protein [Thermoleophilaceae bacterium]
MYARRRAALLLVLAGLAIAAFLLLRGGDDAPSYSPVNLKDDPWAYSPDREADFEKRAAAGHSHVVYVKSPGGIVATAERVERWRPQVEAAAAVAGVDPDLIEGMVLLESAGREDARAGDDLEGAAGLTQILAETATSLLGLNVDVAASERLTRRLGNARGPRQAARLRAARARVDERFDPKKALAATGRYLKQAKDRFGREDLAVVSYHMGMGNLEQLLGAYGDDRASYTQLYFDSSPDSHPRAYRFLAGLGDDSKTYLWRVLASSNVMRLYRDDRAELERLAELQAAAPSGARVLHPSDEGGPLRREAYALLAYIRKGVRTVSGVRAPLRVVARRGFDFDVRRKYASGAQAEAFQYMLDRLQALDLIAWARQGNRIHVTASSEGKRLLDVAPG